MSRSLTTELFVPLGTLSRQTAELAVAALFAAGFRFERQPGAGGSYWVAADLEWRDAPSLDAAWAAFAPGADWGLVLWKDGVSRDNIDFTLTCYRTPRGEREPFDRLLLATYLPQREENLLLTQEFLAWATFLAELTRPWYGWGGSDLGSFDMTPIKPAAVAALEPQPIEWLNVFGAPYVRRLGLDRLLGAPAWRVEVLANGGVAVALAPHPYRMSRENALHVARHLGLPTPPRPPPPRPRAAAR